MMSFPAYIAGLFDGDGHFTIGIRAEKRRNSARFAVAFKAGITSYSYLFLFYIHEKLNEYDIDNRLNKTADLYRIEIGKKKMLEKFIRLIEPHLILKVKQKNIILNAMHLHTELKNNKSLTITDNIHLFHPYREQLHKLARKGRKEIKKYGR